MSRFNSHDHIYVFRHLPSFLLFFFKLPPSIKARRPPSSFLLLPPLFQPPPSMIVVPKQAIIPAYPMAHRRQFSAPPASVVVQPTRTPGLLSLSKPPRTALQQRSQNHQQQQQQPQPRQPRTSKSKQHALTASRLSNTAITTTTPTLPLAKSALVNVPALPKDAVILDVKQQAATPAPSPDKLPRGRSHGKPPKDKTPRRSISPSSRPHLRRQPSPPTDTQPPVSHVHSDPFLVSDSEVSDAPFNMLPVRPTPVISDRPSGNLARRRQPPSPTPAPAKAVPVPGAGAARATRTTLSRSDPVPSHMPVRPAPRRSNTAAQWDAFPVCDETVAERTPPVTPARPRTWQQSAQHDDGPRTAPLSGGVAGFPFNGYGAAYGTPTPSHRTRHHVRTPSDGVFNMSFDEEDEVAPASADLRALFNLLRTPGRGGSFDAGSFARESKEKEKARLFASSMFQNSPSPEELPPPSF
jgi:hypothetical protein